MDGELDGKVEQGEEQQVDQAVGEQQPQPSQGSEEVAAGAGADTGADTEAVSEEEYRAALADRDEKVAALEAQVTEAAKTVESAKALTEQIKVLKAANDEERIGFDLKIAGARNVTAAKLFSPSMAATWQSSRPQSPGCSLTPPEPPAWSRRAHRRGLTTR